MFELLIWIVPLIFSGVILAFGSFSEKLVKILSVCVMLFVLYSSFNLLGMSKEIKYDWIPQLNLSFSILLDEWNTIFILVIAIVATLILIYSIVYIEEGITRYYSIFLLFISGMLGLVLAGNLLQMFIFWEVIGVCSYFLIGFYYKKNEATNAGLKALLTTKIGDACFFLAILLFFFVAGSFDLSQISKISNFKDAISILFVIAILTKSAQFPFYFWLADAMEGPTTVSALLHSSTMVKAGVFLLLRIYPLLTPQSLLLLITASSISLLLGGLLALTNFDLKRILAFSTISQLSVMMLAIGLGGQEAGFIHLINHSFFKSLLFLSAGIIIHYTETRDIRKIKLSRKCVPILFIVFSVGILSLAGIPPFSGFWSKELILGSILSLENNYITVVFIVGSILTILYSLRLLLKVFEHGEKIHEHFSLMNFSIIVLALLALVTAFMEIFTMEFHIETILISLGMISFSGVLVYFFFFKKTFTFQTPILLNNLFENEFFLNRIALSLTQTYVNFSQWLFNTLEYGITRIFDSIIVKTVTSVSQGLFNTLEYGITRIFDSIIVKTVTSVSQGLFNTLEYGITRIFDSIIVKTVTWVSGHSYQLLELDLSDIQEVSLKEFFGKIYRIFKSLQSSYMNYNILAVMIGIIILLFLIIL
jgi:NADH-quinone oxidoreductase subunit L